MSGFLTVEHVSFCKVFCKGQEFAHRKQITNDNKWRKDTTPARHHGKSSLLKEISSSCRSVKDSEPPRQFIRNWEGSEARSVILWKAQRGSAGTLFRVHDRRGQRSLSGVMQKGPTDRIESPWWQGSERCWRSCCEARGQVHVWQLSAKGEGREIKEGLAAGGKEDGGKNRSFREMECSIFGKKKGAKIT